MLGPAGGAAGIMWTSFVGFMASGKTSVAKALGERALVSAVDADALVEQAAALTVPEIFAREGVAGFRRREWEALRDLPAGQELVIATGGGLVETPEAVALLRQRGLVIWLDAAWEVLQRRLAGEAQQPRPLVSHLGWDGLAALYLRRRRLYGHAAHFRLRSDAGTPVSLARDAQVRGVVWRRRSGYGSQ